MGLFEKKYCDICGEKIGLLGNRKLEDGNICSKCAAKLSPFFTGRKKSTLDEIKAQLYETRSWNKGLGQGIIDWKRLAELANAQGCEAFISEREYYHFDGSDGTAVNAAELDYKFLRNL